MYTLIRICNDFSSENKLHFFYIIYSKPAFSKAKATTLQGIAKISPEANSLIRLHINLYENNTLNYKVTIQKVPLRYH